MTDTTGSRMRERIVRRLIERLSDGDATPHDLADAVLDAMREPDRAMLDGARDWSIKKYGQGVGIDGATGCWQSMIDAAKEGK